MPLLGFEKEREGIGNYGNVSTFTETLSEGCILFTILATLLNLKPYFLKKQYKGKTK